MLTDVACKKAACPEGKARERLSDSGGLYLVPLALLDELRSLSGAGWSGALYHR